MGGGGRGRGRGRGGAKANAKKAAAAPAATQYYGTCDFNVSEKAKHQDAIYADLELIMGQQGMGGLLKEAGGSPAQAAFDQQSFEQAMTDIGTYRCGANALWASLATGPVSVNQVKLQQLIDYEFKEPAKVFPETVVIAVHPDLPSPLDDAARGTLARVTPEEPLHAWVKVTAARIRHGADAAELAAWVNMAKNCSIEFQKIPHSKDLFWKQVKERESIGHRFYAMVRTPSGRILEIVHFAEQESKRLRRELSRPEIATAWESNFQSADASEKIGFPFIDAAMKVYAGILRNPEAAAIINACEDPKIFPKGTHWSVYKMVEAVRKCTRNHVICPELVIELLGNINFRVRCGFIEPGELTVKGLSGRGVPGNRGLLDLASLQYDLRNHFLNETLASMAIADSSKTALRKACAGFSAFEDTTDLAWIGVLEPAAQLLHNLIRSMCFSSEHDAFLKRSLKAGQSVAEILSESPLAEQNTEVLDAIPVASTAAGSAAKRTSSSSNTAAPAVEDDLPPSQEDVRAHPIAMNINLADNTASLEVKEKFKSLDSAKKSFVKELEAEAMRIVDIGCQLMSEKATASELGNDLRLTERMQLKGSPIDGYCMFVYVPRVAAESATAPGTRLPPLRASAASQGGNHLRKLLTGAMIARSPAGDNWGIDDGDVFIIADSGRLSWAHTHTHRWVGVGG